MNEYRDFTYDSEGSFKGLNQLVDTLHSQGKKFVPILDAGISYRPNANYSVYDEGVKADIFLKV